MKKFCVLILSLMALSAHAQNVSGFYSGTLYNDTTRQTQVYELALSEYRGKITGYAYVTFVTNDTFYYGIRRVKGTKTNGNLIVEDEEMIANNYPVKPDKGVRRITQISLNNLTSEDTLGAFNATWKTTRTKFTYSLPGTMSMQRSNDNSNSALISHLTELRIQPFGNEPILAKKEEKPKATQKGQETFSNKTTNSTSSTTVASTPKQPATATAPAVIPYQQRAQKLLQTLEVSSDSVVLHFYDNGVVDGDIISVYVNDQNVVAQAKLLEVATKKTVHLNAFEGDEIKLVLVAETLGEMPPNTGLLVVQDGARRYEVRFSADLQTNAALLFKKRK